MKSPKLSLERTKLKVMSTTNCEASPNIRAPDPIARIARYDAKRLPEREPRSKLGNEGRSSEESSTRIGDSDFTRGQSIPSRKRGGVSSAICGELLRVYPNGDWTVARWLINRHVNRNPPSSRF